MLVMSIVVSVGAQLLFGLRHSVAGSGVQRRPLPRSSMCGLCGGRYLKMGGGVGPRRRPAAVSNGTFRSAPRPAAAR